MIKVLHICSDYLGTTLYQKLIESLDFLSIENAVYVPVSGDKKPPFDLHPKALVSNCLKKYDRMIFPYKHFKVYCNIKKHFNFREYNIVHAHSLFSNGYIAYKAKQEFNIPYIAAVRNTDLNVFFKYLFFLRPLGLKIISNASRIVFLSEPYRKTMIESYIPNRHRKEVFEKSVVIPNGIDEYWLNNRKSHDRFINEKKIRLIFVGTIDKNKNLFTTSEACKILIKCGYDVEYTVVGKIIDKSVYSRVIKEPFVKYVSHQEKENIAELYEKQDIFVMPSIKETFGLVYAEAISQGVPIIYTSGQGFDKQFDEGTVGYSVNCCSPNDIAEKIICIMNNYENISQSCRALSNKFCWGNIAIDYVELYQSIIFKRGCK